MALAPGRSKCRLLSPCVAFRALLFLLFFFLSYPRGLFLRLKHKVPLKNPPRRDRQRLAGLKNSATNKTKNNLISRQHYRSIIYLCNLEKYQPEINISYRICSFSNFLLRFDEKKIEKLEISAPLEKMIVMMLRYVGKYRRKFISPSSR